jgi:tRNA modification GTPase
MNSHTRAPEPQATTWACLLTPPGRSALAVVGVRGPAAEEAVSTSFHPRGSQALFLRPDHSVIFGRWGGAGGEDLVVVRRAADDLEVHCHGGTAAAAAILADLTAGGCQQVTSREWVGIAASSPQTERATIAAEARLALSSARGPQAARILAHQLAGSLADAVEQLRAEESSLRGPHAEQLLSWRSLGLRLTTPWRVVVSGPPNAGKSSLVNALAGFSRSLVSPVAGTTRDVLETRLVLEGWDVVLIDTAGLRDHASDAIEQAGVERAVAAAQAADLVILAAASDAPHDPPSRQALPVGQPCLEVVTKSDLLSDTSTRRPGMHFTSTRTGEGIEELAALIIRSLIPRTPAPGEPVPFTERQVAAIRQAQSGC